jgi:hypothetical protein
MIFYKFGMIFSGEVLTRGSPPSPFGGALSNPGGKQDDTKFFSLTI